MGNKERGRDRRERELFEGRDGRGKKEVGIEERKGKS